MAILEIKKAGDPVLKEVCKPVEKIDKRIRTLLDNMAETMYKADGVGIAAPQVGVPLRIVYIDVQDGSGPFELINPVIVEKIGEEDGEEGCLSVPHIFGTVKRAAKVRVEYLNRYGKKHRLTATGLLGRCVQHECDHLEGRLFIDIATSLHQEGK